MTQQEFAQKIRSKYPNGVTSDGISYDKLSDEELTNRVTQKYPTYKTQIEEPGGITKGINSVTSAVGDFFTGVKESIVNRGMEGRRQIERAEQGEISGGRAALRVGGQAAAAVGDVTMEGLKLLAPKFLEQWAGNVTEDVAQTEIAQAAFTKYQELKQKHPEAMQDIEDVFNIASIVPVGKAVSVGGEIVEGAGRGALKTAERVGEVVGSRIPLFNKAVGSIDDVVKYSDEALKTGSAFQLADEAVAGAEGAAAKRAAAEAASIQPSIMEKWAGISPDIKTRISGKYDQLKEYFDVAHTRNMVDTAETPLEHAAVKVNSAAQKMEEILNDTGSKIGAFRKKVGTYQVAPEQVQAVEDAFKQQLKKLNLEVRKGKISQIAGTVTKTGAKNDINVLQELWNDLTTVKQGPNLERLIDLRSSFDRKINFSKSAREVSNSVDPISRTVRSKIADTAADIVGKTEAERLTQYSNFMDAYDMLTDYTNKKTGSEFLLKQVLSERSRAPREVMEAIREYTGIDLMDDAVMSSIATDLIGNSRQKGLFRQEITKAGLDAQAALRGDPRGAIELMFNFLKKFAINDEKQFLDAAKKGANVPK